MAAIDDKFAELLGLNAKFFAAYQAWSEGQIMLLAGTVDDPDSFNAEGGKTGALGYYPVVNVSGQTIYVPCVARLQAMAAGASDPQMIETLLATQVEAARTASGAAGASAVAAIEARDLAVRAAADNMSVLPVVESLDPDVLTRANAVDPLGRLVAQFPDPAAEKLQREVYRDALVESLDPQVTTALLLLDGIGKVSATTPARVTLDALAPVAARAGNLTAAAFVESLDPNVLTMPIVVDAAGKQLGGTVGLPTPIDQVAGQLVTAAGRADSLATRLSRGLTAYGDPLDPVYGRWLLRETHMRIRKRKLGEPVQLIAAFIGDSYTAGVYWVPAAAKTLQDARGLAGLGWVGFSWWGDPSPTVAPAVALRIDGSARPDLIPAPTVTSGWRASYGNVANATPSNGIITATVAGERVTVIVPAGHNAVQLHHKGGGGDIRYSWDGGATWRETITLAGATAANVALLGVPAGNASLVIESVSGTVALAGVDLQSAAAGVRVHKLGASGSATTSWAGVNAAAWRAGLQALAPHLVVIGFLTNDQGAALIPETTFAANLATIVANVRAALPYADILITAPPENQRTTNVYPMWRYARAARELAVSLGCAFLDHQYQFGAVPSDYAAANPARAWYHADLVHPATDTGGRAIADATVSLIDPSL